MDIFYEFFRLVYGNKMSLIDLQNELLANDANFEKENYDLFYLLISAKSIENMKENILDFKEEYDKWLFCKLCNDILKEETPRIYDVLWELIYSFGEDKLTNKIRYLYSTLDYIPLERNKKEWNKIEYELKRKEVLKISEEIKEEIKMVNKKYC